tara:strand:+ start:776 stop:2104 length:1329 start_codon:yes stop_codon:yes gene_type:complete
MRHIYDDLRESLRVSIWFIPLLFCLYAFSLAVLLLTIERGILLDMGDVTFLSMSVSSARQVLGVIAGSVLSIGGVVFSVTMVSLTLTSGQYGPKVLRQFLGDRQSKVSLGLFLGTSVYALVVLSGYGDTDKPSITVIAALAMVMLALGGFIHFIHRTATDLQADKIIKEIGDELCTGLDKLVSETGTTHRQSNSAPWRKAVRGASRILVGGDTVGYVQTINYERLTAWCKQHDGRILVQVRAGDFVLPGNRLMAVYGCSQDLLSEHCNYLRECLITGPIRTPVQDPEYPITQLNQLCARALSPGINDPGTAITCIDWFSMALGSVIDKQFMGNVHADDSGEPRLLARGTDFAGITQAFYAPTRQQAIGNMPVMIALLQSLIRLAQLTAAAGRLDLLLREAIMLQKQVDIGQYSDVDIAAFRQRYRKFRRVVQQRSAWREKHI